MYYQLISFLSEQVRWGTPGAVLQSDLDKAERAKNVIFPRSAKLAITIFFSTLNLSRIPR